jgi:hypothetical protein
MKEKITNVIRAMINPKFIPGNMAGGIFIAYIFAIYYPLIGHQVSCISDPFGTNHAAFIWCFLFGWVYLAQIQLVDKRTTKFLFRVLMPQMLIFFVGLYLCGYPIY